MILLTQWWFGLELVSFAALPLTSILFPGHRTHGYPFSKALGVLLTGLTTWLLAMLGLVFFSPGGILMALVILLGIGLWLLRREGILQFITDIKHSWRRILGWEVLFALALFVGLLLRLFSGPGPGISSTEKLMDFAMISGIFQSTSLPPQDPWLAGFGINYYYLGYLIVAMLARLTGIQVSIAFNLGIATIFALSCITSVGVILMLIDGTQQDNTQRKSILRRSIPAVAVILFLLILGNQAGAIQAFFHSPGAVTLEYRDFLAATQARLAGDSNIVLPEPVLTADGDFGEVREFDFTQPYNFNWWWPSRAVWDDLPGDQNPPFRRYNITEFPFFSFFLGDLHPHIIALPFALLALALAAEVLVTTRLDLVRSGLNVTATAIMTGAILGSLYAINSWDAPTYILLYAGAQVFAFKQTRQDVKSLRDLKEPLWKLLLIAASAIGILIPFLFTFDSFAGGAELPASLERIPIISTLGRIIAPVIDHTSFFELFVMYAPFTTLLLGYLLFESFRSTRLAGKDQQRRSPRTVVKGLWLCSVLAALLGIAIGMPLLAFIPLVALCLYLLWILPPDPLRSFILLAALMGALVILAADTIYLRDPFENRMNTVFKFYYQAWVLWAAASALVCWTLVINGYRRWQSIAIGLPAIMLILAGCIYPVQAFSSGVRWSLPLPSLNGMANFAASSPDEYAAIQWIMENTKPDDVILTAVGQSYDYQTSVVSAATGRPTLLGWSSSHERLWRRNSPDATAAINMREQVIPLIYSTSDPVQVVELLKQERVSFIYVGPTEVQRYPLYGFQKFERIFEQVFHQGNVAIYRVWQ